MSNVFEKMIRGEQLLRDWGPLLFNAPMPVMKLDETQRRAARAQFGIDVDAEPIEWFKIQNVTTLAMNAASTQTKTTAEILIYDIIDPWGVSAGDFANALNELEVDEIVVGINSPGGLVFDGIAIMNALKRHSANVITRIDGLAASAASFIAMAGNEIQTSKYGEMMIHEAWGAVRGNAEDMNAMADLLLRHNQSIASVYADRAGGGVKDWLKLMKNETWFTADEMVAQGLADTVIETPDESSEADQAESLKNRFDLSVFNYAGRAQAPAPAIRNSGTRKGAKMATLKEQLAEKHGLDVSLDDDAFAAALDAKLAEDTTDTADTSAGGDAPTGDQASGAQPAAEAKAKPDDVVTVSAAALAELKAQGAQGAAAFAAIQAEADARMVTDAIRAGKIRPVDQAKWLKNLNTDRDTYAAALTELEPVFPVQEVGHGMNPDPGADMNSADDALGWFDSAPLESSTK